MQPLLIDQGYLCVKVISDERVLGDGNSEEVAPLGEVGGLEIEDDGDEGLGALDCGGL